MKIKLNELFYSLQGEGIFAGTPSVFIRIAGCPLRCKWCDTKYALDENSGKDYSFDEIIKYVEDKPCAHVVVTGGEPMLNTNLADLLTEIKKLGKSITVETAGIKHIPSLKCDLMSISPKLSNSNPKNPSSHNETRLNPKAIKQLITDYNYQLKFVVDSMADFDEIAELLNELKPNPDKVLLMPQATEPAELLEKSKMLADICCKTGFSLSSRLQVLFWPNMKGK